MTDYTDLPIDPWAPSWAPSEATHARIRRTADSLIETGLDPEEAFAAAREAEAQAMTSPVTLTHGQLYAIVDAVLEATGVDPAAHHQRSVPLDPEAAAERVRAIRSPAEVEAILEQRRAARAMREMDLADARDRIITAQYGERFKRLDGPRLLAALQVDLEAARMLSELGSLTEAQEQEQAARGAPITPPVRLAQARILFAEAKLNGGTDRWERLDAYLSTWRGVLDVEQLEAEWETLDLAQPEDPTPVADAAPAPVEVSP